MDENNSPERPSYPPDPHFLRDLGIAIERDPDRPDRTVARLEIVPEILDASGRPRLGVLATLADVIAGESAIRAVLPNWAATSDLSLYVDELPSKGTIEASLEILRSGRQTVILEVTLRTRGADADADTSSDPRDRNAVCGLATLSFMVLPARENDEKTERFAASVARRTDFGGPGAGFTRPLGITMGLVGQDGEPGIMRVPVSPYLRNSLGALQGGAGALLIETTAERCAADELEGPLRVRSLAVHYLKLGRVGPVRATARPLARTPDGLLLRVELRDEGAGDALLSVATVQVERAEIR
jgi:acyl-coenzyme A thioesterase PaaI-like protein